MFEIEMEREADGRWLAEISQLPGVLAYGRNAAEARSRVKALALHVLAERLEAGEALPGPAFATISKLFAAA